jgi:hypothetical protein
VMQLEGLRLSLIVASHFQNDIEVVLEDKNLSCRGRELGLQPSSRSIFGPDGLLYHLNSPPRRVSPLLAISGFAGRGL